MPCPAHVNRSEHDMNIKPDPTGTHQSRPPVFAGVDTHKDVHVAAVVDATGTMLGTGSFATTAPDTAPCWPGCVATAN